MKYEIYSFLRYMREILPILILSIYFDNISNIHFFSILHIKQKHVGIERYIQG